MGETISIVLTTKSDNDHKEKPEFGHRTPSIQNTCIIDLESKQISFSTAIDEVECYELWDASQSALLYSGTDDTKLVETILSSRQEYVLVVVSDSQSYEGILTY